MFLTRIARVSLAFGIAFALANSASAALIAYYAMDEAVNPSLGTTVVDSSGASINRNATMNTDAPGVGTGAIVGEPPANGGLYSYTFNSQATNKNFFNTPSYTAANAFFTRDIPLTYAVWLKPTATQLSNATVIGITGNGYDFQLAPAGSNWALKLQGFNAPAPGLTSIVATIPSDVWSHVAITKGDTTSGSGAVNFYVNGALVESGMIGRPSGSPSSGQVRQLYFASSGVLVDRYYQGGMDELRIYNEALDASTIAGLAAVPEPESATLVMVGIMIVCLLIVPVRGERPSHHRAPC
jgi:hypothetical protein